MASTSDIRKGLCIKYNHDIFKIIEFLHVKPGKGPAFVRTKLKSVTTGKVIDNTFSSGHKIEDVRVETRSYQYLYAEGNDHIFMDLTTYEQLSLAEDDISEQMGYLLPNMEVQVNFHNENPIGMELPLNVVLEVVDTESVVKGQTATSSGKPAKLETGITVTVPQFICAGEKIKVNTGTGEYVERANS